MRQQLSTKILSKTLGALALGIGSFVLAAPGALAQAGSATPQGPGECYNLTPAEQNSSRCSDDSARALGGGSAIENDQIRENDRRLRQNDNANTGIINNNDGSTTGSIGRAPGAGGSDGANAIPPSTGSTEGSSGRGNAGNTGSNGAGSSGGAGGSGAGSAGGAGGGASGGGGGASGGGAGGGGSGS